jgi:hypothetical protein
VKQETLRVDDISIYQLRTGGTDFRAMLVEQDDWNDWRKLTDVNSLTDSWSPPSLRFYKPGETGLSGDRRNKPLPTGTDMPLVFGCLMTVVSQKFVATVGQAFSKCGEFLPCRSSDGEFWIYHCTNELDALDEPRSEFSLTRDGKTIQTVYKYHFLPAAIAPDSVFRINKGSRYNTFITGAVDAAIRNPALHGITTEKIWSSG